MSRDGRDPHLGRAERRAGSHNPDDVFGEENDEQPYKSVAELPTVIPIGWYVLLTLGPAAILLWRYRRIQV